MTAVSRRDFARLQGAYDHLVGAAVQRKTLLKSRGTTTAESRSTDIRRARPCGDARAA